MTCHGCRSGWLRLCGWSSEADGVPVGSCDGVADAEGVGERVGVIEGVGLGVG